MLGNLRLLLTITVRRPEMDTEKVKIFSTQILLSQARMLSSSRAQVKVLGILA